MSNGAFIDKDGVIIVVIKPNPDGTVTVVSTDPFNNDTKVHTVENTQILTLKFPIIFE